MICGWENCTEKNENLADHIYYTHLEHIPKDFGKFKCKWRFCDHETIYKYKSHLSLHLRQHLKEYSEADTKENAQSGQIDKTRSKVDDKTTQSGSVECYVEYKEGEKITCPEASCNVVSLTFHAEISNDGERISIVCKEDDRVICPIELCGAVSLKQTYLN